MKKIAAAIGLISLSSVALHASAAGLGRVTVLSALGEPLRAQLEVTGTTDELTGASAKLASAEAFRLAGVEYAAILPKLKFAPAVRVDGNRRYIDISTEWPVNEPFVDMLVEFSWASGRLIREYTFLLDPPEIVAQRASPSGPAMAAVTPASQPISASASPTPVASAPGKLPAASSAAAQPSQSSATRAAGAPSGGAITVERGDTLGAIAMRAKPADVSLDQMLVALFRDNADAFSGNMNRLHAGAILRVPDADSVRSVDAKVARREVVAQFADFESYRAELAGRAASGSARDVRGGQEAGGRITPRVTEKAAPSADADRLAVSRSSKADAAKISSLEEDLVARDRALGEANSRIAELEKNISDLKRLADMKAKSAPATAAPPPAAPKEPVKEEPAKTEPPTAAPATPPAAAPTVVAEKPAPAQTPPPKVEKKPKKAVPPPPPEPEPTFMEENGPLVLGAAGLATALLGYLGFSAIRRKKKEKEAAESEPPLTQSSLASSSAFGSVPLSTTAGPPTLGNEPSMTDTQAGDLADSVDPLAEADTYLAFGKDAQAEEVLLEALKMSPTRLAIHVKLLEIYAARRSVMQFNTLAEDLKQQSHGRGQEWNRALVLGAGLDPDNPLYRAEDGSVVAAPAPAAPVDLQATMIFTEPVDVHGAADAPAKPLDVAIDSGHQAPSEIDFDLDLDGGSSATAAVAPVEAPAAETSSIDFDLGLGGDEPAVPAAAATATASPPSGLDIDFDLELPATAPTTEVAVASTAAPAAAAGALDTTLQLDSPPLEMAPSRAEPTSGPDSVDFNFDLSLPGEPTLSAAPEAAPEVVPDLQAMSIEMPASAADAVPTSIDASPMLDLAAPVPAPAPEAAPAASMPAPAPASEADNPEAATKLELAAAYEEMGDRDGARELLEEVLAEGSAAQQAAARAKIEQLG